MGLTKKSLLSSIESLQRVIGVLVERVECLEERIVAIETNQDIATATKEEQVNILHDWLLGKDDSKKGDKK